MIDGYTFSKHALGRLLDMNVRPDEVRDCLAEPTKRTRSKSYPGITNTTHGRLTLCVSDDNTVVTALWATAADWRADYAAAPHHAPGRDPRTDVFGRGQ